MKHKLHFRRVFASLLLLAVSITTWAYDFEVDGIYYNISGSNTTVTYGTNKYSGSVTIPSTVTYNDVVYHVTSIGNNAFNGCGGVEFVTIPEDVTSIGDNAFNGCNHLVSITCLAESVPTTAENAFDGISKSYTTLYVPASAIDDYSNTSPWNTFEDIFAINYDFKVGGIYYKISGTNAIVTYGDIDNRGEYSGVIEIPATVKNGSTTYDVTEIDEWAFFECSGLTSITIPESVTKIGEEAFYGCDNLAEVTLNSQAIVNKSGKEGIFGTHVEKYVIGNNVTSIGWAAFKDCTWLRDVTIPNSVTSIGTEAFRNCVSLEEVTIPNSVTSIGLYAFKGCEDLTSVTIGSGVTTISGEAFRGCISLTEITIPNSVTNIGNYAFQECTNLTSVTIGSGVTSIGNNAFYNCSNLAMAEFASIESLCNIEFGLNFSNPLDYADYLYIDGSIVTDIVIPESVTSIGTRNFSGYKNLTSVTIPNSVTSIGDDAFHSCTGLTSITIPESVTTIGVYTFYGCTGLTDVTIPGSVTSIGQWAFAGCTALTSVTCLAESVPATGGNVFANVPLSDATLYVPNGCKAAYETADYWKDFGEITEIYVGKCGENLDYVLTSDNVLTISGTGTMYDYTSGNKAPWNSYGGDIESVVIDNGATSVGDYAFASCYVLTSITIPNSVTSIGKYAFDGCSGLTSITIPNSVTSIGDGAFASCSDLTSITIPNSVTSIKYRTFYGCYVLSSITIPNSVTSIGNHAFEDCSGLTSITIPNSVTSIGNHAFDGCSGLTSITIPNSVTSIDNSVFYNCTDLTSVTIPNSVTSIGEDAFYNCTSLASITIPGSVTSIGEWAFAGCTDLTSVICMAENVPETGDNVFDGVPLSDATLYVPNGCKAAYETADYWKDFGEIIELSVPVILSGQCGENLDYVLTSDYVLTISGTGTMYDYTSVDEAPWNSYRESIISVVIDNGATSIGDYAFNGCSGLTSITIPNSVTSIKYSAFKYCSGLTSITIPNSVTSIGKYVFYGCSGLTSITIPNSVTSIGDGAFRECSALASVTIPNSVTSLEYRTFLGCISLTSITIPNSVTSIGKFVFEDCSGLTSITIPNSVTSIGDGAFYNCTGLTSVTIPNSVTNIGDDTFRNCSSLALVTIPNSVTSIGEWAFAGCSGLTSITIPNSVTSIGNDAFYSCTALTSVICMAENVPETGDNVFDEVPLSDATLYVPNGCKAAYETADYWKDFGEIIELSVPVILSGQCGENLDYVLTSDYVLTISGTGTMYNYSPFGNKAPWDSYSGDIVSVVIDNGATSIGNYAFMNCSSLTSVTIPNSATNIGNYAFYGCSNLTSINIPDGVKSIGDGVFNNCPGLTSITIPNSVTGIGEHAFEGCSGLTSVTIGNSVTSIGSCTFQYCSGLTSVTILGSVTGIGDNAFDGCSGLTSIDIPNSVTSIGDMAFCDCSGLTSITIPNSVTSIGDGAFHGCSGLASLTIPNSVTGIGYDAFSNCTGLTSVIIGNSVTSIGEYAFYSCTDLTSVTCLAESVPATGGDVFADVPLSSATLYVLKGCKAAYETADYWKDFGEIIELSVSVTLGSNGYTTFACPYPLDLENLPDGVVAYKAYAASATTVNFRSLEQTVPANTGILLKGAANAVIDIPVAAEGEAVEDNLFCVNTDGTTFEPDDNTTYYGLIKDSNPLSFGWFIPSSVAIPSNKAYLKVTDGGARLSVSFEDDDVTAIGSLEAQDAKTAKNGKFFENGKIVIVKNGVRYGVGGQKLNR